ncbi:MAG: serine hydrolase, partial [Oscillospiraceae bacterium]|nr:serine hydrolase [Oscillospiraceae bacterium]
MRKLLALLSAAGMLFALTAAAGAEDAVETVVGAPAVQAQAAVLMEKQTGAVLYEENAHEQLEPASVTKIMTLLLVMEAIDSGRLRYDDIVTVSAYATSMGGSQTWMKENEQMSVTDMLKAVADVSANEGSVALEERLGARDGNYVGQ